MDIFAKIRFSDYGNIKWVKMYKLQRVSTILNNNNCIKWVLYDYIPTHFYLIDIAANKFGPPYMVDFKEEHLTNFLSET